MLRITLLLLVVVVVVAITAAEPYDEYGEHDYVDEEEDQPWKRSVMSGDHLQELLANVQSNVIQSDNVLTIRRRKLARGWPNHDERLQSDQPNFETTVKPLKSEITNTESKVEWRKPHPLLQWSQVSPNQPVDRLKNRVDRVSPDQHYHHSQQPSNHGERNRIYFDERKTPIRSEIRNHVTRQQPPSPPPPAEQQPRVEEPPRPYRPEQPPYNPQARPEQPPYNPQARPEQPPYNSRPEEPRPYQPGQARPAQQPYQQQPYPPQPRPSGPPPNFNCQFQSNQNCGLTNDNSTGQIFRLQMANFFQTQNFDWPMWYMALNTSLIAPTTIGGRLVSQYFPSQNAAIGCLSLDYILTNNNVDKMLIYQQDTDNHCLWSDSLEATMPPSTSTINVNVDFRRGDPRFFLEIYLKNHHQWSVHDGLLAFSHVRVSYQPCRQDQTNHCRPQPKEPQQP